MTTYAMLTSKAYLSKYSSCLVDPFSARPMMTDPGHSRTPAPMIYMMLNPDSARYYVG